MSVFPTKLSYTHLEDKVAFDSVWKLAKENYIILPESNNTIITRETPKIDVIGFCLDWSTLMSIQNNPGFEGEKHSKYCTSWGGHSSLTITETIKKGEPISYISHNDLYIRINPSTESILYHLWYFNFMLLFKL